MKKNKQTQTNRNSNFILQLRGRYSCISFFCFFFDFVLYHFRWSCRYVYSFCCVKFQLNNFVGIILIMIVSEWESFDSDTDNEFLQRVRFLVSFFLFQMSNVTSWNLCNWHHQYHTKNTPTWHSDFPLREIFNESIENCDLWLSNVWKINGLSRSAKLSLIDVFRFSFEENANSKLRVRCLSTYGKLHKNLNYARC